MFACTLLFYVNFSDLLQQIYKNRNNKSEERLPQYADADDVTGVTHQDNRCLVQNCSHCRYHHSFYQFAIVALECFEENTLETTCLFLVETV